MGVGLEPVGSHVASCKLVVKAAFEVKGEVSWRNLKVSFGFSSSAKMWYLLTGKTYIGCDLNRSGSGIFGLRVPELSRARYVMSRWVK